MSSCCDRFWHKHKIMILFNMEQSIYCRTSSKSIKRFVAVQLFSLYYWSATITFVMYIYLHTLNMLNVCYSVCSSVSSLYALGTVWWNVRELPNVPELEIQCSCGPVVPKPYVPKVQCSQCSRAHLFSGSCVPGAPCSWVPMFLRSCVPEVLCFWCLW